MIHLHITVLHYIHPDYNLVQLKSNKNNQLERVQAKTTYFTSFWFNVQTVLINLCSTERKSRKFARKHNV